MPRSRRMGRLSGPDDLQPGDFCVFRGQWSNHAQYGRQFKASQVVIEIPRDRAGIEEYLDRHFKWIGPVTARRLVDAFGEKLFDIMEKAPEKLSAIQGITEDRARRIHEEFSSIKKDRDADIWFSTHGISFSMLRHLLERYGTKKEAVRKITENPYALADEIWGIGFKRADAIAQSIGIKIDSSVRAAAGVRWVLQEAAASDGHCYLPEQELMKKWGEE